jgi:hypothetical protein
MRDCIQRHSESMNKKQHNFIHHTVKYGELSLHTVAYLPSISVFNQNNTANCSKTGARTPAVLWTVLPICQDMFIWLPTAVLWIVRKSPGYKLKHTCKIQWCEPNTWKQMQTCKIKVLPTLYTTVRQGITVTTVAQKQQCVHILTFKPNIPPTSTSLKISMSS